MICRIRLSAIVCLDAPLISLHPSLSMFEDSSFVGMSMYVHATGRLHVICQGAAPGLPSADASQHYEILFAHVDVNVAGLEHEFRGARTKHTALAGQLPQPGHAWKAAQLPGDHDINVTPPHSMH